MLNYLIRRLILLPITLFCIILVNFVIVNLAPGEPTTVTEISPEGAATRRADRATAFGSDERYLQFREFYGLTLPILFNTWTTISLESVKETLWKLVNRKESVSSTHEMNVKSYDQMRLKFGDQAKFIMPHLLKIIEDPHEPIEIRRMASLFFVRGGTRMAVLGPNLSEAEKQYNSKITVDNNLLRSLMLLPSNSPAEVERKIQEMRKWYEANKNVYTFQPTFWQKVGIFFSKTRFAKYMGRVLTLDFGTLRNDTNKTVISEVSKRFKYSLTLSIVPMFLTFFICQLLGGIMAFKQNRWEDYTLNFFCLVLYAIPIFVVAPFLIEKVAINHDFPFSHTPIPISGFTSPDDIYDKQNTYQRIFDVIQHIFLPIVAIMYGGLAAQARLSRTAVLEVLRQDYVRTARAKGLPTPIIMVKHVGRNAAITIVTSDSGFFGYCFGRFVDCRNTFRASMDLVSFLRSSDQ